MKKLYPPRSAQKLFEWFCSNAAVEDLQGDIDELFYLNLERMSQRKANLYYWIHTASLLTSYAVRKRKRPGTQFSTTANTLDMLRNYFLIATRSLSKHKFFTAINVLGLAIGMSVSLLFIAMVSFVSTYDEFHTNKDKIYRVISKTNLRDNQEFARTPQPIAEKLKSDYTGIEEVVRISNSLSGEAEFNGKKIPMNGFFVDAPFLRVFTFPLKEGNVASALAEPRSMVITEAGVARMFGDENPIGKVISMEPYGEFEITGVLKQLPQNSHLQFEMLVPFKALEMYEQAQGFVSADKRWENLDIYTYMLLPEQAPADEPARITALMNRTAEGAYAKNEEFKSTFDLQPLADIAPGPDLAWEIGPAWDVPSMIFFGVLTLLILLPACFNYTNISISRALKRSKEIGLRKTVGGNRNQIFFQFILETVIITLLALVAAYGLFAISRNEFSSMIIASEYLNLTPTFMTLLYFVGFAVLVGLVAGAVPALYFSKLNPVEALKSKSSSKGSKGSLLRRSLIVGQFALSLGFIMAVGITAKQHIATLNYNFGFNQENILDIELQGVDPDLFRNKFSTLSAVQSMSMSSDIIGAFGPTSVWIQKTEEKDSIEVLQMFVDHHFLQNLDLQLLAGQSFPDQTENRERFIIVNEEFLTQFKIATPAEALNKSFYVPDAGELKVIGVAKNFHYTDLRMPIQSFFFRYDAKQFRYANLNLKTTGDVTATLAALEETWKTIGGEQKFEARFFDDEIEDTYSVYTSMIKICGFLGFLAISISCLGLLGMVVYATETRTKEIGVRKVMGASSSTIALLLSKDYVKLMLIATAIATPLTYLFFDVLLYGEQYYRIAIGPVEIILSILTMFVLGIATILSQTVKAAKANPVDTLRYE